MSLSSILALLLLSATSSPVITRVAADNSCQFISGNHYCAPVDRVQYNNVGFSGSYMDVTGFDTASCSCSQTPHAFSGTLSPLDEELSVHFRGPINLKQFAYYSVNNAGSSIVARSEGSEEEHQGLKKRAHHHHVHKRDPDVVYVTNAVYVTKTVYAGEGDNQANTPVASSPDASTPSNTVVVQPPSPSSSSSSSSQPPSSQPQPSPSASPQSSSQSSSSSSSSSNSNSNPSPNSFTRTGYYSSSGSSDGIVFLNNMGGAGSGVWDPCFGNSLSYAGSDGLSCASSSTILSDTTLSSNKEFSIFSNSQCSGNGADGSCGFYRPGSVAYHGFGGDTKIFAFEFTMPHDTQSSASTYNYDMPAIWLLNAKVPRTLQYGNAACSCWATGCGELDLFEVLNAGNTRLTTHLHSGQNAFKRDLANGSDNNNDTEGGVLAKRAVGGGGGTADFINRPTQSSMKAAAVFKDGQITLVVLPDSTTFDAAFSSEQIDQWVSGSTVGSASIHL